MTILTYNGKKLIISGKYLTNNQSISLPTPNIKYGYLYNHFAVRNPLFAPSGWHVPSKAEFDELSTYLIASQAAYKLKETGTVYWLGTSGSVTNSTQMFARGSGQRSGVNGTFTALRAQGTWWTSTYYGSSILYYMGYVVYNDGYFTTGTAIEKNGFAIRLIKDDSNNLSSYTDINGNYYNTVKINNQVWMASNWACTKLNDGTPLTKVTVNATWTALTTEGYCAYNNDENNVFL